MFRKSMLQTQVISVVITLTFIVVVGCAAEKEIWGDPETGLSLTYRLPEEKMLKYQTSSSSVQNLEVMGQSMKIETNKDYEFSIKSKGLAESNYKLGFTIDSMDVNITGPQGEVPVDVSGVVGNGFDMTLSPLGKELDLSAAEPIQYDLGTQGKHSIFPDFQSLFPDLSSKPVKVGETWKSEDTIDIENAGSKIHLSMESINTLEGFETVDGLKCIKIVSEIMGTIEGKGEQQGMNLTTKGDVIGTDIWYFAYKEGLLVKLMSNIVADATITGVGPQNVTIPMTQEIKAETILTK